MNELVNPFRNHKFVHYCLCFFKTNIGFNTVQTDPIMSHLATQLGYSAGEFQALNWLSLRCLVSWINHLPPACWSTFWKSNFKQQLGCRFDLMDNESYFLCVLTYAIIYVVIHQIIFRFYLLKYSLFFKYSCTNIFHRGSLYTFYRIIPRFYPCPNLNAGLANTY